MFEIKKSYKFEAGHSLAYHDGKCKHPHGHSYLMTVHIAKKSLIPTGPKTNMVIDFGDISKVVKPMIEEYFDHRWLNETLKSDSPTAEFIAQWIYEYLQKELSDVVAVTVNETESSSVTYRP